MVERVYKMDCQTNPPGGAYIANVNVKGIPLSAIMDKAGVDPSANALHSIADDGWDVYPVSMEYVQQYKDDILLVTEINGEKLGMLQGYPVQLWTPTLGGCHYTKRVVELNFTTDPAEPRFFKGFTNPKTGEMFNKPNTSIFNYTNGTFFLWGSPSSSRASPTRTKCPSLPWRYRWTRARPGRRSSWAKPILCGG